MIRTATTLAIALALTSSIASAQQTATASGAAEPSLPANTPIFVSLNDGLTSKGTHEGQLFDVSVTRNVLVGGDLVIPKGAPGHGKITWRTGKGAFGKSAKMEFELVDITVGDQVVPIAGHYRLEGQGNGGKSVGVIAAGALLGVGIVGAFVTGKSAESEQGTEYRAFTRAPIAFAARSTGTALAFAAQGGANAGPPAADPYKAGRLLAQQQLAAANIQ